MQKLKPIRTASLCKFSYEEKRPLGIALPTVKKLVVLDESEVCFPSELQNTVVLQRKVRPFVLGVKGAGLKNAVIPLKF